MPSRLSDCLVRDGTLPTDVVRAATARQAVYGGALDTALLELGALDEPTLWNALSTATGAPIPEATLFENPDATAATVFDAAWSRRCRAVPVGQRDGAVQICCSEPLDPGQLAAARDALGLSFEVYVVPEVRLAAARQAVYGEVMPPRLLRVLAHLLGAQPVRKWVKALLPARPAPEPVPTPAPAPAAPGQLEDAELAEAEFDVPVNTFNMSPADILESRPSRAAQEDQEAREKREAADEVARALGGSDVVATVANPAVVAVVPPPAVPLAGPAPTGGAQPARAVFHTPPPLPTLEALPEDKEAELCAVASDPEAEARLAALRLLRGRLDRPRVRQLAERLRAELKGPTEVGVLAAGALGELRDAAAVLDLIEALGGPASLAQTAARALVEITAQDFGQSRKKWEAWWQAKRGSDRIEWLLEGLSHKSPEIRFASSEELRVITGEYFGYHFDLPKREREEARERWQAWWYQSGHARLPDRR
jgi:hypothetical protein